MPIAYRNVWGKSEFNKHSKKPTLTKRPLFHCSVLKIYLFSNIIIYFVKLTFDDKKIYILNKSHIFQCQTNQRCYLNNWDKCFFEIEVFEWVLLRDIPLLMTTIEESYLLTSNHRSLNILDGELFDEYFAYDFFSFIFQNEYFFICEQFADW